MEIRNAFSVVEAVDWLRSECDSDRLKILSGVRGAGKSTAVDMFKTDLLNRGVRPEDIVHFDLENRGMRNVSGSADILAMLPRKRSPGANRKYLVVDEITVLVDFEKLVGVLYSRSDFNVLLTISNRRLMTDELMGYFEEGVSECRLFPGAGLDRTPDKLDSIWLGVLVRDILGGHVLADATATEQLAGYVSDHLCEVITKKRVSAGFTIAGAPLSANTVGQYLDRFQNAYLIEGVYAYDLFSGDIVRNAGRRVFCIDPELRRHRFGSAPEKEAERSAYNARYLELRREYGRVCWLKTDQEFPDFVIFPEGENRAEVVPGLV